MLRQYKIRKFRNGNNSDGEPFINYSMTIPSDIAERLPAGLLFSVELTEDGILFRPTGKTAEDQKMPDWAKRAKTRMKDAPISSAQGSHQARPKRARPSKAKAKA